MLRSRSRAGRPAHRVRTRRARRQWGTEDRRGGLPVVPPTPTRRAVSGARFAVFLTVAGWLAYLVEQIRRLVGNDVTVRAVTETTAYLVVVSLLTMSACAYLLARLGHLTRSQAHRRVPRSTIDDLFDESLPTLTVIVPSYREDVRVVQQTLLSAALQEYPDIRVVLLVDDPPNPTDPAHQRALREARELPHRLAALLDAPRRELEAAMERYERSATPARFADPATLTTLAGHYERAADWLSHHAAGLPVVDHSDEFLVIEVLDRLAGEMRTTAGALRVAAGSTATRISPRRVHQLYRRLVWTFRAEITSFERKQFASLSHEANKAMNLNSYIGLMGGAYVVQTAPGGNVLVAAGSGRADLEVPDPDYVLTLDADSILLPEYCLRLVYFMEQPANAGIGVVQTPYSAYRGAASRIERIAGATTDLQHLVHQGLTRHGATFWVGANAVLRKRALDDIVEEDHERGFTVRRYVQDRTVVEDTESSIDLRTRGWRLYNYPERLSYSATPPDFGALVVQRQRWANGGLVILPKIRSLLRGRDGVDRAGLAELFLRVNYLASITWASLGLLVLLAYPFDERLLSRYTVLTALPYFVAMANDLKRNGYKRTDLFRLYGFNLLLLPVNLSGVVKSVVQAIGGQKIAFARTPKVKDRTVAPLLFVVLPYLLIAWAGYTLARDLRDGSWVHAVFAGSNAVLTAYAVAAFVGIRHSVTDVVLNLRELVYRPARPAPELPAAPDWVTVLYHGPEERAGRTRREPLAAALAAHDQRGTIGSDPVPQRDAVGAVDLTIAGAGRPAGPTIDLVDDGTDDAGPVGGGDDPSTAALLARCVELLSRSGEVVVRNDGDTIELRVVRPDDTGTPTGTNGTDPR